MKIIVNEEWHIITDELNWTLGNPRDERGNRNCVRNATYHPTLKSALAACFERRLLKETDTIIINHLKKAEKEIAEAKLVKYINKIKDEIISAAGGK